MTRFRRWLPLTVLCAALAVLFYRLFLGEVIFWGIPLLQFAPWRDLAFSLLRDGVLPLWNPLAGNGAPLLANYQTAVFYPPNWLYLLAPAEYAMGLLGLVHLVIAGAGMMLYLRHLGVDRLGQGVGAISFALSGFMVARFGFLTMINVAAWLPWLLWAVDRLAAAEGSSRRDLLRGVATLSGIVALILLAGHAQLAFYSLLLAGTYALWRVLTRPAGTAKHSAVLLSILLGGVLLGVALAAVQLIPTYELTRLSQRASGVDYEAALSYSFWPGHFVTLLLPDLFGSPATGDYIGYGAYWEDAIYTGLLTLALVVRAILHWWQARRDRPVRGAITVMPFYLLSLLPVTVFALGWNTPIFPWLFRHVPTFDLFNGPARWMLLAVFALSVMGGVGADRWTSTERGRRWAGRGVAVGMAFLLAAAGTYFILGESVPASFVRSVLRFGVVTILVGVLMLVQQRILRGSNPDDGEGGGTPRKLFPRLLWEALALCLLAADLVTAGWGLTPTIDADYYHQPSALAEAVPEGTRTLLLPGDEYTAKFDVYLSFRSFHAPREHWDALRLSLLPNLGMLDEIPAASNFDPLQVGWHTDMLHELESLPPAEQVDRIGALNVGLLLATSPRGDLELLARQGDLYAYRIPDPWQRVELADCDPEDGTIICTRLDAGSVRIMSDEVNRVEVTVEANAAAYLVLVDTWVPGWRATVDGSPVEILRANDAFRAVEVPAGAHEVVFEYRPASFWVGLIISLIAFVGWGAVILPGCLRVRNH